MKYDKFLATFRDFIRDCPEEILDDRTPYVFLSDLHMGDGSSRDDLEVNRSLIEAMLEHWYLERGYMLILNGDIEDLNKFSLPVIQAAWPQLLEIIEKFDERGKLRKIVGNHDYDLLPEKNYRWKIYPGLVYRSGENKLFVFHGHQASSLYVKYDFVSEFLIRYFLKPLHIRNSGVSNDSHRRFRTEKRIYRAARAFGAVAITGHTHRPLFESLAKYDNIRITLEDLLREYIDASAERKIELQSQIRMYRDEMKKLSSVKEKEKKTQSLYGTDPFFIPCVFNSGCATGKHGITAIEIEDGKISLVYWTVSDRSHPYIANEARDRETIDERFFRYTIKRERLDSVFTRINLLGESDSIPMTRE